MTALLAGSQGWVLQRASEGELNGFLQWSRKGDAL